MRLRNIPELLNPITVAEIDARLDGIRKDHGVAIPLAIESGSRAWGFPSPDSDYDCRFIFLRSVGDYLSLFPMRDVIETPLDRELDVNGWDLSKALKLLLKGNAVVIEWLTSPIVYSADVAFRDECLALAHRYTHRGLIARHYLHLGERQRRTYFADGKQLPLKKIFYALRPAAALRWLRLHPDANVAPMHFPTLMAECDAPEAVRAIVNELIEKKAIMRELGEGELPDPIASFIDGEFVAAAQFGKRPEWTAKEARADVQAFFRKTLSRFAEF